MSHDKDATIRTIAHRLWEEDGRPEGQDVEIWLRAEKLASGKTKPAAKAKAGSSADTAAPVKKAAAAKAKPAAAPAPKKPAAKKAAVKV